MYGDAARTTPPPCAGDSVGSFPSVVIFIAFASFRMRGGDSPQGSSDSLVVNFRSRVPSASLRNAQRFASFVAPQFSHFLRADIILTRREM